MLANIIIAVQRIFWCYDFYSNNHEVFHNCYGNVILLNVIMLNAVMLNLIIQGGAFFTVVLNVIMLCVVMLIGVAP